MKAINTKLAPAAIGTYSQAVVHGDLAFLSGQIPLDAQSMELVRGGIEEQIRKVLDNLSQVALAAGTELSRAVKLNVYLTDLGNFQAVNQAMADYFHEPYPARAAVGVSELPKGAEVEIDAVIAVSD